MLPPELSVTGTIKVPVPVSTGSSPPSRYHVAPSLGEQTVHWRVMFVLMEPKWGTAGSSHAALPKLKKEIKFHQGGGDRSVTITVSGTARGGILVLYNQG